MMKTNACAMVKSPMVSLWDMLTLFSGCTALAGAAAHAAHSKTSLAQTVFCWIIGALAGGFAVVLARAGGNLIKRRVALLSDGFEARALVMSLYLGTFAWILFATFLGYQAAGLIAK
jgi:hypothetical protein